MQKKLKTTLLSLLIVFIAFNANQVTSQSTITNTYQVNVYMSETQYYSGTFFLSFKINVYYIKTENGYLATNYEIGETDKQSFTQYLTIKGLESTLIAPSLTHYSIPVEKLEQAKNERKVNLENNKWELIYLAKSAVSLSIDRIEEGYQVILSFPGGSKEIIYDDETGLLLSELFYIRTTLGQTYVVYSHIIDGPSFIGDEGIPKTNILAFQLLTGIITLLGILAYITRSRYRIL